MRTYCIIGNYLMHYGDLGRKSKKETVFVHVWLVHFAVQ